MILFRFMFLFLRYIIFILLVNFGFLKSQYTFLNKSDFTSLSFENKSTDFFSDPSSVNVIHEVNRISDFFEIAETLEDSFHNSDGILPVKTDIHQNSIHASEILIDLYKVNQASFKAFKLYLYYLQLKIPFVKEIHI